MNAPVLPELTNVTEGAVLVVDVVVVVLVLTGAVIPGVGATEGELVVALAVVAELPNANVGALGVLVFSEFPNVNVGVFVVAEVD